MGCSRESLAETLSRLNYPDPNLWVMAQPIGGLFAANSPAVITEFSKAPEGYKPVGPVNQLLYYREEYTGGNPADFGRWVEFQIELTNIKTSNSNLGN